VDVSVGLELVLDDVGRHPPNLTLKGGPPFREPRSPALVDATFEKTSMTPALIIVAIVLLLLVLFLMAAIKVAREYERGIVFRLGRLFPQPKGPGLFILIPVVDRMVKVDLRTVTLNIPPQEVITRDNVPARVNAVAYFRIVEPKAAIVQVENFMVATSQIAQTTLRSVLGQHVLDELLSERDKINAILQEIIDEATTPWGIKVARVEVKDLEIPSGMQQAMARQAEAERERRAKIINAEGEFQASERLKDAALVIEKHPTALQLRYLQTLLELGGSQSTTIVFPAPIDLIRPFIERTDRSST
jgi:regulator of protease activity HflC (stomatin/prohibitin superfamily)